MAAQREWEGGCQGSAAPYLSNVRVNFRPAGSLPGSVRVGQVRSGRLIPLRFTENWFGSQHSPTRLYNEKVN